MRNLSFSVICCWLIFNGQPAFSAPVTTIAGNGENGYTGDTHLASAAQIANPYGLVVGPDRALYVCEIDNHVIRRIDADTGVITTVAGTGRKGYSGDGGPATQAELNEPYEVRFDSHGNLYFVEMKNAVVRKVDQQTGIITTIAGTGQAGFSGDGGPATQAQFKQPHSICFDSKDRLFICDIGNHRIRCVDPHTGLVSTLAGTGQRAPTPDGSSISAVPLNGPRALDFDGDHSMYLVLREGNALYRIDLESKTIHHVAGNGQKGYSPTATAKQAKLSGPKGVAVASNGDVYFADTESHTIRVYRAETKRVETVVGNGQRGDGPDGDPLKCQLARPHGVCLDKKGNLFIGDSENHRVRCWPTRPAATSLSQ